MPVTRDDLVDALAAYWGQKTLQLENSRIANAVGAGTAGSVRGGKQFDPVAALIAKFFVEAGYPASSIRINRGVDLPGYFRPSKQWDVVVGINGVLVRRSSSKLWVGRRLGTTPTTVLKRLWEAPCAYGGLRWLTCTQRSHRGSATCSLWRMPLAQGVRCASHSGP